MSKLSIPKFGKVVACLDPFVSCRGGHISKDKGMCTTEIFINLYYEIFTW